MTRSRALDERLTPLAFLRPYRLRFTLGAIFLVAGNLLYLAEPLLLGMVIDSMQGPDPAGEIPILALLMVAFAVATGVTRLFARIAFNGLARKIEYDVRSRLFGHLLRLEPAFYRRVPVGDIMSRLSNDTLSLSTLWGPGSYHLVDAVVSISSIVIMMLVIDPALTLWALLPFPAMVALGKLYNRRLYRSSRAIQTEYGRFAACIQEDLSGVGVIKAHAVETKRLDGFRARSGAVLRTNLHLINLRSQLMPVLAALASLGTVIVLFLGGAAVIDDRIRLGELVAFNAYVVTLVWPTLAAGALLAFFQRSMASWSRIKEILAAAPSIVDGRGPDLTEVKGEITVRNLTLAIDGKTILDAIDLHIPAGSLTAIVGRTGSGKSTLVQAIPRLIDAPPETIFLDGRDIADLPLATVRGAIGYAQQEAFLFSMSIGQNIAFGCPDEDLGHERVTGAATAAGLDHDLAILPEGSHTIIGERGVTLSGGQRQRVALARALATLPRILILDDSLSSVDAETEREILAHLREWMKGRTAIVISHRVAAIKDADHIVVIDGGAIVESGTHEQLIAARGVYAAVYRAQLDFDELGARDAPA